MDFVKRLEEVAEKEYWQPAPVQVAARMAVAHIRELEALTLSQAERIAAQSELLSKAADREPQAMTDAQVDEHLAWRAMA